MGEYTFLNRNQYVETSQPIEEKNKTKQKKLLLCEMGWRDYCQRNKPIPPFVMINHLSVWLPVWPGNTLATAGPSGWWPRSSPSGPHLFPHALFRCLCRPGSAPFGPQLCPWPRDRISPAAHSFHRLLCPCPPALRPAPSSKKKKRKKKVNFYIFLNFYLENCGIF